MVHTQKDFFSHGEKFYFIVHLISILFHFNFFTSFIFLECFHKNLFLLVISF